MKGSRLMRIESTLIFLLGTACAATANADMLTEKNVMVSGPSVPQIQSLNITMSGQLTVKLTDIVWPKVLSSLSFALTDGATVLQSTMGAGTLTYQVTSPGAFFACVYAQANPAVGIGLYHIEITFTPHSATVPVPASAWLLLSGICGFAALRGKRATVTNLVV